MEYDFEQIGKSIKEERKKNGRKKNSAKCSAFLGNKFQIMKKENFSRRKMCCWKWPDFSIVSMGIFSVRKAIKTARN